jgi:DNA-binding response OmpR family regulator
MPKKILVVDDELNVLRVIASRLKANNYDVVTASDGIYAVKKAVEEKPDLIILDIKMPAGGGVSVFENLRHLDNTITIPVIFITAYPTEEIKSQVLEMGAVDFVAKPFNPEELLAKVKKAMGENIERKESQ